MSIATKKMFPCLWFDNRIEEAVNFYVALFGGKVLDVSRYGDAGPLPKGTVMTMMFTLHDEQFMALNGVPHFKFSEAVSFVVKCKDQAEVDKYWDALTADGGQESQCGWCKDRFGLSWQITPTALLTYTTGKEPERAKRAMQAMFKMKKIDIAAIEKAAAG